MVIDSLAWSGIRLGSILKQSLYEMMRYFAKRYLHQETEVSEGSSGSLADPLVYRWDNHNWSTVVAV